MGGLDSQDGRDRPARRAGQNPYRETDTIRNKGRAMDTLNT